MNDKTLQNDKMLGLKVHLLALCMFECISTHTSVFGSHKETHTRRESECELNVCSWLFILGTRICEGKQFRKSMFKSHLICATHYHTSINLLMPRNVCHDVHSALCVCAFSRSFPIFGMSEHGKSFFPRYSATRQAVQCRRCTNTHT